MTHPTSSLLCPRCQETLFLGQASGVDLHACGHCGGLWIDNTSAQRICSAIPEDALALADSASRHATGPTDTSGAVACPVCSTPCRRSSVASARADIDLCDQHGTWFDRGELRQITWALKNSRPQGAAPAIAARSSAAPAIAAVGLGAVGVAGVAAASMVATPHQSSMSTLDMVGEGVEVVATGFEVVEAGASLVELGGAVAEVAGGVFEVLGGIFSILG